MCSPLRPSRSLPISFSLPLSHTNTHTHTQRGGHVKRRACEEGAAQRSTETLVLPHQWLSHRGTGAAWYGAGQQLSLHHSGHGGGMWSAPNTPRTSHLESLSNTEKWNTQRGMWTDSESQPTRLEHHEVGFCSAYHHVSCAYEAAGLKNGSVSTSKHDSTYNMQTSL